MGEHAIATLRGFGLSVRLLPQHRFELTPSSSIAAIPPAISQQSAKKRLIGLPILTVRLT